MNRDFFIQKDDFKIDLVIFCNKNESGYIYLKESNIYFNIDIGKVFFKNKFITCIEDDEKLELSIISLKNTIYIVEKDILLFSENAISNISGIVSSDNIKFIENIYGIVPNIQISHYTLKHKTFKFFIESDSDDYLEIFSIKSLSQNFIIKDWEKNQSYFEAEYIDENSASEFIWFELLTNAGVYKIGSDYEYVRLETWKEIKIETDSIPYYPYSECKFFLRNDNEEPALIKLDFNVFNYDDFNLNKFIEIEVTGNFSKKINQQVNKSYSFLYEYDGEFIGENENRLFSKQLSGRQNVTIYTEGILTYNYEIPVDCEVDGKKYSSITKGVLNGYVGPGSGTYHFNQDVFVSGLNHAFDENGEVVIPDDSLIFSGSVDTKEPLSQYINKEVDFCIKKNIEVIDKTFEISDIWSYEINSERGFEDKYILPGLSTTVGKITYNSQGLIKFDSMIELKITDQFDNTDYINLSL